MDPEMLEKIHKIVNEFQYPVLFKNILKNEKGENLWQLLNWDFNELSAKIGGVKLPFREGENNKTLKPQWEHKCSINHQTLNDFLELTQMENNSKWYYFDYKYMHDWFKDNKELLDSVNWKLFGYDVENEASTWWIGSKGAHTNCHKDTYGKNLVVQVLGRKQWILFPPETENFKETRDPYEESTIYTNLNLFTPSLEDVKHLKSLKIRPRVVTLEPGNLLFVPHGWWHFVESLDTSLSVNIWLPLKTDCFNRLNEAIVKLIVNRIGCDVPVASDIDKNDLSQCLNFVEQSLAECKLTYDKYYKRKDFNSKNNELQNIFENSSELISIIKEVTLQEYEQFLDIKMSKFGTEKVNLNKTESCDTVTEKLESQIVNAICNSKIIKQIVETIYSSDLEKN